MLAILGDYLKNLSSEIETYEQLITQKRAEVEKLSQLQGQVVEALGSLKGVVDELSLVDPEAISIIQNVALQIFDHNHESQQDLTTIQKGNGSIPSPSPVSTVDHKPIEKSEVETLSKTEESHEIRLSQNVLYQPDYAIVYAGINSYHRSQTWGEWLCVTHTVGDRFEVQNQSRSKSYNYDLVVFEIKPEDAQRLADINLAISPSALANSTWQPQKRHRDIEPNQAPLASVSNLEMGDIARTPEGKEYPVMEVSQDGLVVKLLDEQNQMIELPKTDLLLVNKAEMILEENFTHVTEAFSNSNGNSPDWAIGNLVRIHSNRYKNQYNGQTGAIATQPSNFGLKVDLGGETPIFFLKDEVTLLD
jgi:hypothetical protein